MRFVEVIQFSNTNYKLKYTVQNLFIPHDGNIFVKTFHSFYQISTEPVSKSINSCYYLETSGKVCFSLEKKYFISSRYVNRLRPLVGANVSEYIKMNT